MFFEKRSRCDKCDKVTYKGPGTCLDCIDELIAKKQKAADNSKFIQKTSNLPKNKK